MKAPLFHLCRYERRDRICRAAGRYASPITPGGGLDGAAIRKQWGQFFAGGLLALAYFASIVVTTAPH